MKKVLEEIQSGAFAKEWMAQAREGAPFLNEKREEASKHQLENIGKESTGSAHTKKRIVIPSLQSVLEH